MRFHADCSFHIGAQHLRTGTCCQDYAVAGALSDRAYVVVSDGCSSGGRTDVGARLVGLAAARALRERYDIDPLHYVLAARPFDLELNDLLATCLTISVTPEETIIRVQGDGVVAIAKPNGALCMIRMDWAQNMPCYPAYADDGYVKFIAAQGGTEAMAFRIETDTDNVSTVHRDTVAKNLDGHTITVCHPVAAVAVFSDGVTQVDGIPWQDAVRNLMAFKSVEGDFVKRRMNRFLRDAEKIGRGPIDDIAMAAIVIEAGQ